MLPSKSERLISERRLYTDYQWSSFVSGVDPKTIDVTVPKYIVSSWKRCLPRFNPYKVSHAPTDDDYTAKHRWQDSHLRLAATQECENIKQLAREGSLVAAIADKQGHLLWTFASQHMRSRAEAVNFVAGGHWDEGSAGTNAVGLALKLRNSTTVFSSEHYLPIVHDWVCYAAPIIHPQTQQVIGVLDISTTWRLHTPLGQAAVANLARAIAGHLPQEMPHAELELHALGVSQVVFRGKTQRVSQRQLEILSLLALNPQGLNLESFHAVLYGDNPISLSTLKAELSHLRRMLDGQIGSRPYRLLVPFWADFIQIWQLLQRNQVDEAFKLYQGPFLPQSDSPELEEWRHCVDAVMSRALNACGDVSVLMRQMCQGSSGSSLVRERLSNLAVI